MMLEKAKRIKMLIMDVDGVLTQGEIILDGQREIKAFSVRDGVGIVLAQKAGLIPVFLTARSSSAIEARARELGVKEVHQAARDKVKVYQQLLKKYNLSPTEVAYMGDELIDIPLLKQVGLSSTPADGVEEVKEIVDYVAPAAGGKGAIRELVKLILKLQGKWEETINQTLTSEKTGETDSEPATHQWK